MEGEAKVLVTGFEPFGGETVNPSAELLALLDGECIAGHRVATASLPCCFADVRPALERAIERHAPVLVLAIGQAGGRARLSFERVAVNLVDARIADNAGEQPVDEPVLAGAPQAHFTTLPVKAMVAACSAAGVPAELSLSAGTYVCNAAFFLLMQHLATACPGVRGGFLHIPWLPTQAASRPGAPAMDLATVAAGVRAALAAALATREDLRLPAGTIC